MKNKNQNETTLLDPYDLLHFWEPWAKEPIILIVHVRVVIASHKEIPKVFFLKFGL